MNSTNQILAGTPRINPEGSWDLSISYEEAYIVQLAGDQAKAFCAAHGIKNSSRPSGEQLLRMLRTHTFENCTVDYLKKLLNILTPGAVPKAIRNALLTQVMHAWNSVMSASQEQAVPVMYPASDHAQILPQPQAAAHADIIPPTTRHRSDISMRSDTLLGDRLSDVLSLRGSHPGSPRLELNPSRLSRTSTPLPRTHSAVYPHIAHATTFAPVPSQGRLSSISIPRPASALVRATRLSTPPASTATANPGSTIFQPQARQQGSTFHRAQGQAQYLEDVLRRQLPNEAHLAQPFTTLPLSPGDSSSPMEISPTAIPQAQRSFTNPNPFMNFNTFNPPMPAPAPDLAATASFDQRPFSRPPGPRGPAAGQRAPAPTFPVRRRSNAGPSPGPQQAIGVQEPPPVRDWQNEQDVLHDVTAWLGLQIPPSPPNNNIQDLVDDTRQLDMVITAVDNLSLSIADISVPIANRMTSQARRIQNAQAIAVTDTLALERRARARDNDRDHWSARLSQFQEAREGPYYNRRTRD